MRRVLLVLLTLALGVVPVRAQSQNPTVVEFDPSPDHATAQKYVLTIRVVGSAAVVKTIDLGKPTPDFDGKIRVEFFNGILPYLPAGATYEARVEAVNAQGSTPSAASNPFQFTTTCPITLDTSAYTLDAFNGRGSFYVRSPTGCRWTVAPPTPAWLTVTWPAGLSMAGDGPVVFSGGANNGGPRAGAITVEGVRVPVTQPAIACTYTATPVSLPLVSPPATIAGHDTYTWESVSTDARALATVTGRIKAAWYGAVFSIDVDTGARTRRLALYMADYDPSARQQVVTVVDATGAVVDTRTVSEFSGGRYLLWRVRGHVSLRVTRVAGPNAVVSGVFLSNGPDPTKGQVEYDGDDALTKGDWVGIYGQVGALLAGQPSVSSVSSSGGTGIIALAAASPICNWAAASTVPWITLSGLTSGTGTSDVAIQIAANMTTAPRSGSIVIGGQTVTLTQSASTSTLVAPRPAGTVRMVK